MDQTHSNAGPGTDSRLIFGCMGLGGGWDRTALRGTDIEAARRAVQAALDIGVTVFDHADIYRFGKAEEAFGEVLRQLPGLRETLTIQSKCGIRLPGPGEVGQYDLSGSAIVARVEESLRRLGTDYLDILLLHRPDPLMHPDDVAEAFEHLKASGKVLSFGVSNMSGAQMDQLQQSLPDPLVVNQLEMSLLKLDWLESGVLVNHPDGDSVSFPHGTLEYCRKNGVQLQAWGSLAQGLYSGTATAESAPRARATAALVEKLASEKSTAREAIVLAWLMKHPAGIQPVIGTAHPSRILACRDAERQAALMTRQEWYALWTASRGRPLP